MLLAAELLHLNHLFADPTRWVLAALPGGTQRRNTMKNKKLSRSLVALALSAAIALTGCDADPDDPGTTSPGDTTVTTVADLPTTTVGGETTTTAP